MSSEKSIQKLSFTKEQKTVLLGAGIIFGVVVIIALASFFFGKREGAKNLSAVPIMNVSGSPYQKVLGAQTTNWEGKIISVDSKKITFSPVSGGDKNKKLTAVINNDTQLLHWDLTSTANNGQPQSSRTPATLSEFKTGSTVYVQASISDSRQSEFTAMAISLLIKPKI